MKDDSNQGKHVGSSRTLPVEVAGKAKQSWGTELERKLAALPYPVLSEAFRVAAEAWEGATANNTVARIVNSAKTFSKGVETESPDWYFEAAQAAIVNRPPDDADPKVLPLSECLAFEVFTRLWWLSELLKEDSTRPSLPEVVTEISNVCVLAERARHVLYTEQRVEQWDRLVQSGRLSADRPRKKATAEAVLASIKRDFQSGVRWHKKHRQRYATTYDAATAFLETTLTSSDPMNLHVLFRIQDMALN